MGTFEIAHRNDMQPTTADFDTSAPEVEQRLETEQSRIGWAIRTGIARLQEFWNPIPKDIDQLQAHNLVHDFQAYRARAHVHVMGDTMDLDDYLKNLIQERFPEHANRNDVLQYFMRKTDMAIF